MRRTSKAKPRRKADLSHCEDGNVTIVFGLAAIPIMLMIGASADYARYAMTRSGLQQATDSAALTVASKMNSSTTLQYAKSQAQINLNAQPRMAEAQVMSATISADKQTFCVDTKTTMTTSFMQLMKVKTLSPTTTACATLGGAVDPDTTYEIALVLDNSGSMLGSAGGKSKIDALRDAATSFINTMHTKSKNVKFSIAPFAAGVVAVDPTVNGNRNAAWVDKAGVNSQHWIAFGGKTAATAAGFVSRFDIYTKLTAMKSSWDWGGCFEQPAYPNNVNDVTPTPTDPETLFVPYLAPDEPDSGYTNSYLDDNGGSSGGGGGKKGKKGGGSAAVCSDTASGEWNNLTHVCKYKATSADGDGDGPNSYCPSASTQTVMQLTPTKTVATNKISALVAGGYTNLHEGFMWGWRSLSPNLPFAGGRSYNAPKNRKIVVFMTDGFNNWKSDPGTITGSTYQAAGYYSYGGTKNGRFPDGTKGNNVNYQTALNAASGSSTNYHDKSREMQDELTSEACTNAKAAGLEIFTIGFSTPSDPIDKQGLDLMKACATNPEHYFAAENASQLNAAFEAIGTGLGKLRLSQ